MSKSHAQLAHEWAAQSKASGKGFNVFYEGATIYSYGHHFAIARHTTDANGNACVLMTTRGYSVSTEKHKGHVWRALAYGNGARKVYTVQNVLASTEAEHRRNFDALNNEAGVCRGKASRARTRGAFWGMEADRLDKMALEYGEAFGIL